MVSLPAPAFPTTSSANAVSAGDRPGGALSLRLFPASHPRDEKILFTVQAVRTRTNVYSAYLIITPRWGTALRLADGAIAKLLPQ